MQYHIDMDAARLLRHARARSGLSQRALADRSGVPQPMVSTIERGLQDPRLGTLDKLLRACGHEVDLVVRGGEGVDRTQFIPMLRLTVAQRLRAASRDAQVLAQLDRARR